jgi:hypothetical protein
LRAGITELQRKSLEFAGVAFSGRVREIADGRRFDENER